MKIKYKIFLKKKTLIIGLIHQKYLNFLKNKKKYIAFTKTKSQVKGGGRKPWNQKGTGRARAGSIRSPLWRGGGICFGPKPHILIKKINKKEKKIIIDYSLYFNKSKYIFINELQYIYINTLTLNYKTKNLINYFNNLKINLNEKILFLLKNFNKNLLVITKNLINIKFNIINSINVIDLLIYDKIILSPSIFFLMKYI